MDKNKNFFLKISLMVLISLTAIGLASASHTTSFDFLTQAFNLTGGTTYPNMPVDLEIYATSTCSGTPLFTSSCTTDVNGVCDINVTMDMNFNQVYYACIYGNNTLTDGSPYPFRAGQGQIDEEDVSFDNLTVNSLEIDDYLDVSGDATFGSTVNVSEWIWADGNITTQNYFVGDGSYLTNVIADLFNISANEWLWFNYPSNSEGIMWNSSAPSRFEVSDDIHTSGEIYVDDGNYVYLNTAGTKGIFWDSGNSKITSDGNFYADTVTAGDLTTENDIYLPVNRNIYFDTTTNSKILKYNSATNNRFEFNDNLYVNGSVNATSFYGDGSGLYNLPVSSYWNRTGTTLEPATSGDAVLFTGKANFTDTIQIADDIKMCIGNPVTCSDYFIQNTSNGATEFRGGLFDVWSDVYIDGYLALTDDEELSFDNSNNFKVFYNSTSNRLEFDTNNEVFFKNLINVSGGIVSGSDILINSGDYLILDHPSDSIGIAYNSGTGDIALENANVSIDENLKIPSNKKIYLSSALDRWVTYNSTSARYEFYASDMYVAGDVKTGGCLTFTNGLDESICFGNEFEIQNDTRIEGDLNVTGTLYGDGSGLQNIPMTFGSNMKYAVNETSSCHSTNTWIQRAFLNLSNLDTGTYRIDAVTTFNYTDVTDEAEFKVTLNGNTNLTHSVYEQEDQGEQRQFTTFAIVNLTSGVNNVTLDFNTRDATETICLRDSRLMAYRIE